MEYNYGSSFGYDQIATNPLLNNYDAPYTQLPKQLRDSSYSAAAGIRTTLPPYKLVSPKKIVPLDSLKINKPYKIMDPMQGFKSSPVGRIKKVEINYDDLFLAFLIIIMVVLFSNTIKIKSMRNEINILKMSANR